MISFYHQQKEYFNKKNDGFEKINRYNPSRSIVTDCDVPRFLFYNRGLENGTQYSQILRNLIFKENINSTRKSISNSSPFLKPFQKPQYNGREKSKFPIPVLNNKSFSSKKHKLYPAPRNFSTSKNKKTGNFSKVPYLQQDSRWMNNSRRRNFSTQNEIFQKPKQSIEIDKAPFLVLDAPDLYQDFYLNLIDFNINKKLCVGLNGKVYIWDYDTHDIFPLVQYGKFLNYEDGNDTEFAESFNQSVYVSSVKFHDYNESLLSIGKSNGEIDIFNITKSKLMRTIKRSNSSKYDQLGVRCSSLDWNCHVLTSGGRNGILCNHDIRVKNSVILSVENAHDYGDICGLKWNKCGRDVLATGGNDNCVVVWELRNFRIPRVIFKSHSAAVKAIDWNDDMIISGGGRLCKKLLYWNSNNGKITYSKQTHSQISGVFVHKNGRGDDIELITAHGEPSCGLNVWNLKENFGIVKKITCEGHRNRILFLCQNRRTKCVVSAAADETLRFWNVWSGNKHFEKEKRRKNFSTRFKKVKRKIGNDHIFMNKNFQEKFSPSTLSIPPFKSPHSSQKQKNHSNEIVALKKKIDDLNNHLSLTKKIISNQETQIQIKNKSIVNLKEKIKKLQKVKDTKFVLLKGLKEIMMLDKAEDMKLKALSLFDVLNNV